MFGTHVHGHTIGSITSLKGVFAETLNMSKRKMAHDLRNSQDFTMPARCRWKHREEWKDGVWDHFSCSLSIRCCQSLTGALIESTRFQKPYTSVSVIHDMFHSESAASNDLHMCHHVPDLVLISFFRFRHFFIMSDLVFIMSDLVLISF